MDGLRAIRDLETPLDPSQPKLGPKANQLLVTNAGDDGRDGFIRRFAQNAFGSKTSVPTVLIVDWLTVRVPVH